MRFPGGGITPILPLSEKQVTRFWAKVGQGGEDQCWPWLGARGRRGYGKARIKYRHMAAHRIALALHTGTDPIGKLVKHSCDNPSCCNPKHLSAGSQSENVIEAFTRGRRSAPRNFGEGNGRSVLTRDQAAEIIAKLKQGRPYGEIAREMKIDPELPRSIMRGKAWRELAAELGLGPGRIDLATFAIEQAITDLKAARGLYPDVGTCAIRALIEVEIASLTASARHIRSAATAIRSLGTPS